MTDPLDDSARPMSRWFEEAALAAREIRSAANRVEACLYLASASSKIGGNTAAQEMFEEAKKAACSDRSPIGQMWQWLDIASTQSRSGQPFAAEETLDQAKRLVEEFPSYRLAKEVSVGTEPTIEQIESETRIELQFELAKAEVQLGNPSRIQATLKEIDAVMSNLDRPQVSERTRSCALRCVNGLAVAQACYHDFAGARATLAYLSASGEKSFYLAQIAERQCHAGLLEEALPTFEEAKEMERQLGPERLVDSLRCEALARYWLHANDFQKARLSVEELPAPLQRGRDLLLEIAEAAARAHQWQIAREIWDSLEADAAGSHALKRCGDAPVQDHDPDEVMELERIVDSFLPIVLSRVRGGDVIEARAVIRRFPNTRCRLGLSAACLNLLLKGTPLPGIQLMLEEVQHWMKQMEHQVESGLIPAERIAGTACRQLLLARALSRTGDREGACAALRRARALARQVDWIKEDPEFGEIKPGKGDVPGEGFFLDRVGFYAHLIQLFGQLGSHEELVGVVLEAGHGKPGGLWYGLARQVGEVLAQAKAFSRIEAWVSQFEAMGRFWFLFGAIESQIGRIEVPMRMERYIY